MITLEMHMFNVFRLSNLIGQQLGIKGYELNDLSAAAALHDIGKLKVPKDILYKPGKLTPSEFEIIKKHSKYGAEMLEKFGFEKNIVDAVLHHHERYDGLGYPCGLYGTQIPLYSRVISVADAFDAMTTNRSYGVPKSYKQALEELNNNSGIQFDPYVVNETNKVIKNYKNLLTMDKKYNMI